MTIAKTSSLSAMPDVRKQLVSGLSRIAREAYVYGSFAKGLAVPGESDVDLLVVPKKKISLDTVYAALDPAFERLISRGFVLHIVVYQKGMERLLREAKQQGVRIM